STNSLSQVALNTANRGAIASIGAMRETYPGYNTNFAGLILTEAMINQASTLGEAIWNIKSTAKGSQRTNDEKYVLQGEPTLALPQPEATITLDSAIDTLQALDKVKISGTVTGGEASGKVYLQVREGNYSKELSQEITSTYTYRTTAQFQGNLVYSEILDYTNGRFSTEFITPRKLNFGDTGAQIRTWSYTTGSKKMGRGLVSGITFYGTSSYKDSIDDDDPPSIQFRACGLPDSLARAYSTSQVLRLEIPACIEVLLTDSTGLDMTDDADEGVSFEVVDYKDPWHPWPFLEQSGKRIVARMNFSDKWNAGTYTFRVRALDILGNAATSSLQLQLTETLESALEHVFNAPNPMGKSGTTFYFRNLAENYRTQVSIEIFGVDGRLVQVIRNAQSGVTHWDGRDHWGRLLANGLYHYVVTCTVYPTESSGKIRRFRAKQKLVISR
ncbi:MAG TPA: C25 family cysteine peptidase, partial [Fibrobacteraceae bacterium]|nr:C25 family cysteine peptidase [Fibrobacteraceae bacterium]